MEYLIEFLISFFKEYLKEVIIGVAGLVTLAVIQIFWKQILTCLKSLKEKYLSLILRYTFKKGEFTSPSEDSTVSETIRLSGNYSRIRKTDHLWVFSQIGNLVWPKFKVTIKNNHLWEEYIHEPYARENKPFKVQLVYANKYGNKKIIEYLESSSRSKDYEGQVGFEGTIVLDVITLNTGKQIKPKKNK